MKKTMLMVGDVIVNDIEESKLSRTCHIWVKPKIIANIIIQIKIDITDTPQNIVDKIN